MATMAVNFIGSDTWNEDVYGTVSFAARFSGAINNRILPIQLRFCVWRLNNKLDDFFVRIHGTMDKYQKGTLPVPSTPQNPDSVTNAITSLNVLHSALERIYEAAQGAGLMNKHSIVFAGLQKLQHNDERVIELREWLEDMHDPCILDTIFASAQREFELGETVTLSD